jgi:hypothetical protein
MRPQAVRKAEIVLFYSLSRALSFTFSLSLSLALSLFILSLALMCPHAVRPWMPGALILVNSLARSFSRTLARARAHSLSLSLTDDINRSDLGLSSRFPFDK